MGKIPNLLERFKKLGGNNYITAKLYAKQEDGRYKSPFGPAFGFMAHLLLEDDGKPEAEYVVSTAAYQAFISGKPCSVEILEAEAREISVLYRRGGAVRPGDELTELADDVLLTVGCCNEAVTDYYGEQPSDIQLSIHNQILDLWAATFDLDEDDPDFFKEILKIHEQSKGRGKPAKKEGTTTSGGSDSESSGVIIKQDDSGVYSGGTFFKFSAPGMNKSFRNDKDNRGSNDGIDASMKGIMRAVMAAIRTYLRVRNSKDPTGSEVREEYMRYIDYASDPTSPDIDSGTKADEGPKEEIGKHYSKKDCGIGVAVGKTNGRSTEISLVLQAAIICSKEASNKDASAYRKDTFAKATTRLLEEYDEALKAGVANLGSEYLNSILDEVNVYNAAYGNGGSHLFFSDNPPKPEK